jgi:hypothetical protein
MVACGIWMRGRAGGVEVLAVLLLEGLGLALLPLLAVPRVVDEGLFGFVFVTAAIMMGFSAFRIVSAVLLDLMSACETPADAITARAEQTKRRTEDM